MRSRLTPGASNCAGSTTSSSSIVGSQMCQNVCLPRATSLPLSSMAYGRSSMIVSVPGFHLPARASTRSGVSPGMTTVAAHRITAAMAARPSRIDSCCRKERGTFTSTPRPGSAHAQSIRKQRCTGPRKLGASARSRQRPSAAVSCRRSCASSRLGSSSSKNADRFTLL